jgi:hypothetical protein
MLASRTGLLTPWEISGDARWIGGSVGFRAGLDAVEGRELLSVARRYTD